MKGKSSSFREDCDKALQIIEKFQHMGYSELQYELDVSEIRLKAIINYLVEKLGYIKLCQKAQFSKICQSHSNCIVSRTELEKIQNEMENKNAIRKKLIPNLFQLGLETFKELAMSNNQRFVRTSTFIEGMTKKKISEEDARRIFETLINSGAIYEIKPNSDIYRKKF